MRIVTPRLYSGFVCLASACPDTCCAAWEIELDAQSAARYAADPSLAPLLCEDGVTLRQSGDGACPSLDRCGLCRAYAERPRVCREYPLYRHDLGSRRELGLSFSCPALLPQILMEKEPLVYDEVDDPSVYPDTYSEIDPELLPPILEARQACFGYAADASLSLFDRMRAILFVSGAIDRAVRRRRYDRIRIPESPLSHPTPLHSDQQLCKTAKRLLAIALSFEYLDPAHRASVASALAFVGSAAFPKALAAFGRSMAERTHEYEKWLSQSLYRSYGFAAETRDPLLRAKASVAETLLLYLLGAARYGETGDFTLDDQAELFRIFSREYEHSTENPSLLRRKLRHPAFSLHKLLAAL